MKGFKMIFDFSKIKIGGWIPDLPDIRDFLGLPEKLIRQLRRVPERYDLLEYLPYSHNQTTLGSCVMQGCCTGSELLDKKIDRNYIALSVLMGYFEARKRLGKEYINQDSGAYIRDGIKVLNKIGVCSLELWPYEVEKFTQEPPAECYESAKKHKLIEYRRLLNLSDIKAAIFSGSPVVAGFTLYESFMDDNTAATGEVQMPEQDESVIGGHCMLIVGYEADYFIVVNSWGAEWGHNGLCYVPYDYLPMMDDMWMMSKINYNQ